ncbi:MAG TPA: RDD family protein [Dehalococcoidia bacterium]|nr:RDD family protein [Dehalococcoidia bacterium]
MPSRSASGRPPSQDAGLAPTPALRPAGLGVRAVAFVLDVVVLFSFLMVFAALALLQLFLRTDTGARDSDAAVWTAVYMVLGWLAFVPLYHIALWAWRGQTVGQMAVRVKVVRGDGGSIGPGRALLRFVVYAISVLFLFLGFVPALMDERRRGLPDLVAGTVVIDLA